MPIATPEIYAEMLGRAKENSYAFPAINCTSSESINAAIKGFADAGSDGIIQFSTGGAEFGSGLGHQGHGGRRDSTGRIRAHHRGQIPDPRRAAHRPLPQGQARHLCPAAAGDLGGTGRGGQEPAVPVAHVGRLGGADRREPGNRAGTAEARRGRQDHPGDRDRRGRRRRGRRRARDQRQALHHPRGLREDDRRAGPRRARSLPAGRDIRQRARRLQARQRQAASRHPGPGAEGGGGKARPGRRRPSHSTSSSTAVRARRSRRSRRRCGTAW